jgi:hypothetical protein
LLIPLILISCGEKQNTKGDFKGVFFDLKAFAEKEAITNKTRELKLQKSISINEDKELIRPDSIDWEDELRPLSNNDINKSSWVDKFSSDTSDIPGGKRYTYVSEDKEIPVKKLVVEVNEQEEVTKIQVKNRQRNPLYKSSQDITYLPDKGYTVKGSQKAFLLKEHTYLIQATILPKQK